MNSGIPFLPFPFLYGDSFQTPPLAPPGSRQSFRKFQELFATGARLGLANGDVRGRWFRSLGIFVFRGFPRECTWGRCYICDICLLLVGTPLSCGAGSQEESRCAISAGSEGPTKTHSRERVLGTLPWIYFSPPGSFRAARSGRSGFRKGSLGRVGMSPGFIPCFVVVVFVFFSVGSCNVQRLGLVVGWFRGQLQNRTTGLQTTTGYSEVVDCRGVLDQLIRLCALGYVNVGP